MMFKGTKQFGKGEFSRIIKSKGGVDNAATFIDWTYYWQLMSKEHLELALKLESDRMQNALFDPKEFEAEKVVVHSELEGRESDPDVLLYDNMRATAYQEHSYRWATRLMLKISPVTRPTNTTAHIIIPTMPLLS